MFLRVFIFLFLVSSYVSIAQNEGSFYPIPGNKYLLSGWVKEIHSQQQLTYKNSGIEISFIDGNDNLVSAPQLFLPTGNIIDGWQRIVGLIEIPIGFEGNFINIELKCFGTLTSQECYFDDIRFYPYNGTMKSFVYDEGSKKLLAELDENNYATFYEYDNEGGLVRVKKETERGVFTIQESRSSTIKRVN